MTKRHDGGNSLKTFFCGLIIGVIVTYFSGVSKPSIELAVESLEISEAMPPKSAHVVTSTSRRSIMARKSPNYETIRRKMGGDFQRIGSGDGAWVLFPHFLDKKPAPIIYGFGVGKKVSWDTEMIEMCDCEMWAFDNTPVALGFVRDYDNIMAKSNRKLKPLPRDKWHLVKYLLGTKNENITLELPPGNTISFAPSLGMDINEEMFELLDEKNKQRYLRQKEQAINERGAQTITLPARSLDFLMDMLGHKKVDILKMDIESAEFGIIRDWAERGWTPPVCQLLIEFHARMMGKNGPVKYQQALADLRNLGFTEFYQSDELMDHGYINLDYC